MSIAEKLQNIAENEQRVFNAGYEKGLSEGGNTEEAYNQGVEDGKQAEYDALWNLLQPNNGETIYYGTFAGISWTKEMLRPKHDVRPIGSSSVRSMFLHSLSYTKDSQLDMAEIEQECGIVFDFSGATGTAQEAFRDCCFKKLNVIDFSNIADLTQTFASSSSGYGIERIERLILNNTFVCYGQPFSACRTLQHIGFEGVFDTGYNVSFKDCIYLDGISIKSLINILSPTRADGKITLSLQAVNKAFETSTGANDGSTSETWLLITSAKTNWTINLI